MNYKLSKIESTHIREWRDGTEVTIFCLIIPTRMEFYEVKLVLLELKMLQIEWKWELKSEHGSWDKSIWTPLYRVMSPF